LASHLAVDNGELLGGKDLDVVPCLKGILSFALLFLNSFHRRIQLPDGKPVEGIK